MDFDCEKGLISKLIETKDVNALNEYQIKPSFFVGENRRVFTYILKQIQNNGAVPTVRAIEHKFPDYELYTYKRDQLNVVGTEEVMSYWCEELHTKVKHNKMVDLLEEVADNLDGLNTEQAYEKLRKGTAQIENEIVVTSSVKLNDQSEQRKEAYLKRERSGGMLGISTGFNYLDYITKGLIDGCLITIVANTGVGKAVTLDTPILTPNGFIPMRNIKVGSKVFDESGKIVSVVGVYPQGKKQVYRVHFEDSTYVDCCKDHLWKFKTQDDLVRKKEWRVETLEQLLKRPIRRGRSYNLCVPVCNPIQFEHKKLPLDPYVLGCLLGDGGFTTDRITFSNPESDLLERLNESLCDWGTFEWHKGTNCQFVFKSNNFKENKLYRAIKTLGLIGCRSEDKFVPRDYLIADVGQRRELLMGLIDTDGSVDSKGHIHFYTKSKQLQNDFAYLVHSLGFRCYSHQYDRGEKGIDFTVTISGDTDELFSSVKHKLRYESRYEPKRINHYEVLKITSIEKLPYVEEMQCISVSGENHTFICGDFVVTHNTWFESILGSNAVLQGCSVAQFVTEMSTDLMQDRYESILFSKLHKNGMNYSKFKSGRLSKEMQKEYFEFLDEELPTLEPIWIETATGVIALEQRVRELNPDLILVDGVYLMDDDQNAKDDWLRVAHITRDLKKLAKRLHKPIVINSQLDENTGKKVSPKLGDIKYTQAIGQDSDVVIFLYRDEAMLNDREMCAKVGKNREGENGTVTLNWDFTCMNFSDIYTDVDMRNDTEDGDSDTDTLAIDDVV